MSTLASSLKRLSPKVVALELFGNAALFVAAALWLEIPDSHLWQLLLSLLFGALLLVGTLGLHSIIIRRLRAAYEGCSLWISALLLAAWAVVLYLPSILTTHLSPAIDNRASYWNSQLSPHMRTVFTYLRLVSWQVAAFDLVVWFIVPVLLLPFILETVACGVRGSAGRNALRVLTQWTYWATCIVVGLIYHFAVSPLVDWQPARTVHGEIVSLVLRLGVVYVALVVLLTLLITTTTWRLAQSDIARDPTPQPADHNAKPVLLDE